MDQTLTVAFLGLLEGLTEFLPVSSTGHLLLAGHFLSFDSKGRTFEVVIQLGAILALTSVYAAMVTQLFLRARHDDAARRAIVSILLAFLPAVVVGLLAHDFIKTVLFETPMLIAIMLILGGFVLLVIDRIAPARCTGMRWRCRWANRWRSGFVSAWRWFLGSAGPGRRLSARC